ncbi:hypothetical protein PanWU01x14_230670, partial [Parasponia andersonii]
MDRSRISKSTVKVNTQSTVNVSQQVGQWHGQRLRWLSQWCGQTTLIAWLIVLMARSNGSDSAQL